MPSFYSFPPAGRLWRLGAVGGACLAVAAPLLAQIVNSGTSVPVTAGISLGGLIAVLATWIGIFIAYMSLRRGQIADFDSKVRDRALAVFNAEMSVRGRTFADREAQDAKNDAFDKRLEDATNVSKLCGELSDMTRAIYALSTQVAGRCALEQRSDDDRERRR